MPGPAVGDDYYLRIHGASPDIIATLAAIIPVNYDAVLLGNQSRRSSERNTDIGAFLLRVDRGGGIVWQEAIRSFGPAGMPPSDDWALTAVSVAASSGGYMVVGNLKGSSLSGPHLALAFFNLEGKCQWLRIYDSDSGEHATGIDIIALGDPWRPPSPANPEDFLVVGLHYTVRFGVLWADTWIFRVDPAGNPRHGFRSTGLGLGAASRLRRFADTILLVGMTGREQDANKGPFPGWLEVLDSNGKPLWDRAYLTAESGSMTLTDVAVATNNWLAVAGNYLMGLDRTGRSVWAKEAVGLLDMHSIDSIEFRVLSATPAQGGEQAVSLAGFAFSVLSVGATFDHQPWLAQIDEAGNPAWQKRYPNPGPRAALGFVRTRWMNSGDSIVTTTQGFAVRSHSFPGGVPCGHDFPLPMEPRCFQTMEPPPAVDKLVLRPTEFIFAEQPGVSVENRCPAENP